MHPILFKIGSLEIYSYGVLVALGFIIAVALASRHARTAGLNPERITDLCLISMMAGLAGARALHVLLNLERYSADPLQIIMVNRGGLAVQGGLLAGILAGWFYTRSKRLPVLKTGDAVAPYIALGQSIGRIGCLLNGCCYGSPTSLAWGLYLPGHLTKLHPTQIYMSVAYFGIFLLLLRMRRRKALPIGGIFTSYLILFSVSRFIIDYFRQDIHPLFIGLRTSQIISLAVLIAVIPVFWVLMQKRYE